MRFAPYLSATPLLALLVLATPPAPTAAPQFTDPSRWGNPEPRRATEEDADTASSRMDDDFLLEGPLEVMRDPPVRPEAMGHEVSPAGTVQVGPFRSVQVNVDADGNNLVGDAANEPSLAVSPVDPRRIVVGWRQFRSISSDFREAGVGTSADGGHHWSAASIIDPGVFRSDPVLVADAEGSFHYFALTATGAATGFRVDLFKSLDGGRTWLPAVNAFGGDKPWFTSDRTPGPGRGNLYGSWNGFFSCCSTTDFTRSVNFGAGFEYPLDLPSPRMRWGSLDVGPDGTLYVGGTLNTRRPNAPAGHVVVRSSDAQNRFAPMGFELAREVNLGGRTNAGGINQIGLLGQVWLQTDHSAGPRRGNVYLLGSVERTGIDPADVMFTRSTDRAQTWSAPVRINDDPAGSGAWQWFGTMAVAPNGRIDVIWNDTRADPGNRLSVVMYAYSLDGGESWSPNVPVSPPFDPGVGYPMNAKLGDYYHLVSDNGGGSLAYAATFNGEQDVYFLRIPFDCDGNGIEDDCDIACGPAGSRCDVAGCGGGRDGDGNGVLDACGNAPPTADAGPDQVVECASFEGAEVRLDGSGSSDPDGGGMTYRWTGDFGAADGPTPLLTLPLGEHTITLEVTDDAGVSDRDEVLVNIGDTTAPQVACEPVINPHGGYPPPAPGRGIGPAAAGFYRLVATDLCSPQTAVTMTDDEGSGPFGPFGSGTGIKVTQAPGVSARVVPMAGGRGEPGDAAVHLLLPAGPVMEGRDASGNVARTACPVPPRSR